LKVRSKPEKKEFAYLRKTGALSEATGSSPYLEGHWVKKKDGSVRLVVNGRHEELQQRYLLDPKVNFSESASGAIIKAALSSLDFEEPSFLSLDLKSAYYSIRLNRSQTRFLTIRIEGRVWRFNAPPQGLSSSTGVCVETFSKWWSFLGMTSSFSDNAIFVGTMDQCKAKLESARKLFSSLKIRLNEEQCTIQKRLFVLGMIISRGRYELPPSTVGTLKVLLKKEKAKTLTKEEDRRLNGYRAYLSDLNLVDSSGLCLRAKNLHQTTIVVDGAKGTAAAAIVECRGCKKAVEVRRKKMRGSSQAATEQHALILGLQLAVKHGAETIGSDVLAHTQLMTSNKRDRSMAGLAVDNVIKKQKRVVKVPGGDDNTADKFARMEDSKEDVCVCGDELLDMDAPDDQGRLLEENEPTMTHEQ